MKKYDWKKPSMRAIAYNVRTKSELECGKISFKDQIDNAKGQLISKCFFGAIVWTKKPK